MVVVQSDEAQERGQEQEQEREKERNPWEVAAREILVLPPQKGRAQAVRERAMPWSWALLLLRKQKERKTVERERKSPRHWEERRRQKGTAWSWRQRRKEVGRKVSRETMAEMGRGRCEWKKQRKAAAKQWRKEGS